MLGPKNEAPRRSARTKRGTTNYVNFSSDTADNIGSLRLQFLSRFGIDASRARLVAALYFGEAA